MMRNLVIPGNRRERRNHPLTASNRWLAWEGYSLIMYRDFMVNNCSQGTRQGCSGNAVLAVLFKQTSNRIIYCGEEEHDFWLYV
jgi:hypothetical protein